VRERAFEIVVVWVCVCERARERCQGQGEVKVKLKTKTNRDAGSAGRHLFFEFVFLGGLRFLRPAAQPRGVGASLVRRVEDPGAYLWAGLCCAVRRAPSFSPSFIRSSTFEGRSICLLPVIFRIRRVSAYDSQYSIKFSSAALLKGGSTNRLGIKFFRTLVATFINS
jgi:hypothetical protein